MISLSHRTFAAFVAAPLLLAAPAFAQDRGGNVFDNLFSRGEPQRQQQAVPNDDSELVLRLERLENSLRQMTGMIEQLQFRNQQLEQALKRAQDDNEFRFQQLGARAPAGSPPPAANAAPGAPMGAPQGVAPTVRGSPTALPPAAAPQGGKRSDVFDPSQQPNAPGAPRTLGGGAAIASAEPDVPVGAPGGRPAGAPLDLSSMSGDAQASAPMAPPAGAPSQPPRQVNATLPPSQSPKDEYDLAYGYVLRKDYALAEQAFRDYLRKNPNDSLAPDANYWLGETLFQRQRYQDSADAFLVVVRNHDKSGKAPDALLRLGQSLAALKQKDMACASLNEVERKYPKASGNVKRAVAQEQKRVGC